MLRKTISGKREGRETEALQRRRGKMLACGRLDSDMQEPVDWNSEEGKQATARLNHFLVHVDKTVPEGFKRTAVPLGTDENGELFGIMVWKKQA